MIISKIDGTKCKNMLGLAIHLKKYNISVLEYHIKYENFIIPKCIHCSNDAKHRSGIIFYKTCCSSKCKKIEKGLQVWSEESKEKQRIARFKFLKNKINREKTAWHNKSSGNMSYGEK